MTGLDPERDRSPGDGWAGLAPGADLTVVKLAPDGSEAARYAGVVVSHRPDRWVVVRAIWTYRTIELGGLSFCPGDSLLEWFSPRHPFNAFAVFTPADRLKGWYANVTHPARLDVSDSPLLIWHDLYLDLVGLPDGSFTLRDDDELLASGMAETEPELHALVLAARAELVRRFERRLAPFAAWPEVTACGIHDQQNAIER